MKYLLRRGVCTGIMLLSLICPTVLKAQLAHPADTAFAFKIRPEKTSKASNIISYAVPAAMIGYGVLSFHVSAIRRLDYSIQADRQEDMPHFHTTIDNYMQYSPTVAAFALSALNVKGKHTFGDRAGIFLFTEGIMGCSIFAVKKIGNRMRPNQEDMMSFPSGHTGNAFAAAEFLNEEYGDQSPWYGIAGYAAATATGVFRVYNNAHWFSDVIAGAGFGILSAKAASVVYPFVKEHVLHSKSSQFMLMPQYGQGYTGAALVKQF